jgi:hypothetical protein
VLLGDFRCWGPMNQLQRDFQRFLADQRFPEVPFLQFPFGCLMCLGNGRDPSSPTLWVTPIATRAAALAKSPNRSQWTKNKNKSEIVSEVS